MKCSVLICSVSVYRPDYALMCMLQCVIVCITVCVPICMYVCVCVSSAVGHPAGPSHSSTTTAAHLTLALLPDRQRVFTCRQCSINDIPATLTRLLNGKQQCGILSSGACLCSVLHVSAAQHTCPFLRAADKVQQWPAGLSGWGSSLSSVHCHVHAAINPPAAL